MKTGITEAPRAGAKRNKRHARRALTAAFSLAIASCANPYEGGNYGGSASITHYQPGYRITSLPQGYRSETISGRSYYYHNGSYYQRNSGGYVVIEAPRQSRYYEDYNRYRNSSGPSRHTAVTNHGSGYRLRSLPRGYRTESISGRNYYYHNGAYYQRDANGYFVTRAPRQSRYYAEYTSYR